MIEIFGYRFSYRLVIFSYAILGLLSLSMAFIAEYVFALMPCKLCLLQRWPYLLMIVIGVFGFGLHENRKMLTLCLLAIVGCFVYGGSVAVYQTGGEQGWWLLTADCSSVIDPTLSTEDYLAALKLAPTVPCDVVKWSLFGISMAGYNAFFSIFMAVFTLSIAIKVALTKELNLLV